ncbi:MAG: CsgG/HfaB family protein [Elusimicrobiota bacterium]
MINPAQKHFLVSTMVLFLITSHLSIIAGSEQPTKPTIAVAEFEGQELSKTEMQGISEFIRTGLVNTDLFNVVDRRDMDRILEEQKFQVSGCTTQDCVIKMGKLLNVQKIVTGKIIKMGGEYYVTANVLDVETGKISISERMTSPG